MELKSINKLKIFLTSLNLSTSTIANVQHHKKCKILYGKLLNSPLGELIAISDENDLLLLQFMERSSADQKLKRLIQRIASESSISVNDIYFEIEYNHCDTDINNSNVVSDPPIVNIENELNEYFNGELKEFHTSFKPMGTPFQIGVWKQLINVPYGEKHSYAQLAENIGRTKAYRSVAQANAANPLVIIVPCHRIINSNGNLGGYNGGLDRKDRLISLETKCCT